MENKIIFKKSTKHYWVEEFKKVFLEQDSKAIENIFDIKNFGLHNGFSLLDYCEYEFKEFRDKSENFGLTLEAEVACYDLDYNLFYFSLGKKEDKALFEAIFGWDEKSKKAIGNQYFGKIEPKMQFFKKNGEYNTKRRINIKPTSNIEIKKVLLNNIPDDDYFGSVNLSEVMGGKFYSYTYETFDSNHLTHWEQIKLYTDKNIIKYNLLMRGIDHPLFIKDLYPTIINKNEFLIKEDIHPVIIYVLKESGKEEYFKYPKNKHFIIDENIQKVCLTDTLSFDWIVEL